MTHKQFIEYWENYYSKNKDPNKPSPFALFIKKYLKTNSTLLELGCGNGRDSLFFSTKLGLNVLGVDQSKTEINYLNKNFSNKLLKFLTDDFSNSKIKSSFDNIYSRFTIHSIDKESELRTLKWVFNHLNKNGHLFIEVRSTKDDLFGKGKKIAKNSFVTDHFRRFIEMDELINTLTDIGFKIISKAESNGLAIHKNEDPVVIRIIAQKI